MYLSKTTIFLIFSTLTIASSGTTTLKDLTKSPSIPEIGLTIHELIEFYGYTEETHEITTEDGYILTLNHILPENPKAPQEKGVVLLVPALFCSAAIFLFNRDQSIAYYLTEAGYDVWLLNYRGTTYSRRHIELDPDVDKTKFWDYSFHEMGYYDVPATIDHILEQTGQKSLYYIGHSQGTTTFFAMASSRPEYNEKIRLAVTLAPVAHMEHMTNELLSFAAHNINFFKRILAGIDFFELVPHWDVYTDFGDAFCGDDSEYQDVCVELGKALLGLDMQQVNKSMLPLYLTHVPAGCSKKQLYHYQQSITEGTFRQYDYGLLGNLLRYGQSEPPTYDISKITSPVALLYAKKDQTADVDDVKKLISELPNVALDHEVAFENFTHADFVIARESNLLVNEPVLQIMQKY